MKTVKAHSVKSNPLSTIAGLLVLAVAPFLAFIGVIKPDDLTSTQGYISQVFTAIADHLWITLFGALGGLFLIYRTYDAINWKAIWEMLIKNPKTSIVGVVSFLIIPVLVYFNILDQETGEQLKGYWSQLMNAYSSHQWETMLTIIITIIGLFSKDKAAS